MKKKVLVVYHYFAHYRLPVMKKMSDEKKAEFDFLSGETSDIYIEKVSKESAGNLSLNWSFVENIWLGSNWLWQKGLIWKSITSQHDVVIFLGSPYFISTWLSAIILKVRRKKVLFWTHGVVRNGGVKDTLRKFFFKLADGLLVYSSWAKNNLIKHGFEASTLHVINNSLDYDKHVQLRNKLDNVQLLSKKDEIFVNKNLPILLFIGRLTPQKKLVDLISLVVELKARGLECNLLFIGDGDELDALKNEVINNNLENNVVFYGACHKDEELAPLIAMSDVCVSPGEVGLTAIHCMSFGTPVITHDEPMFQMPEFESITEGVTGAFFKRNSFYSLIDCVENWIRNKKDRELVRRNCYNVVDRFYNPEFQVHEILQAIK